MKIPFPRAAALITEEQPTQRAGDLETCCYHFIRASPCWGLELVALSEERVGTKLDLNMLQSLCQLIPSLFGA